MPLTGEQGSNKQRKPRQPRTPGEILKREFLDQMGLTQKQLACHLGCKVETVVDIIHDRAPISAEMALKLGAAFQTTPEFWMNAQKALDLYRAQEAIDELPPPVLRAG